MSFPTIAELKTILSETDGKYRDGLTDISKIIVALSATMISVIATLAPRSIDSLQPNCTVLLSASLILLVLTLFASLLHIYEAISVYRQAKRNVAVIIQETPDPEQALHKARIVTVEYSWFYRYIFPFAAICFSLSTLSLSTYALINL